MMTVKEILDELIAPRLEHDVSGTELTNMKQRIYAHLKKERTVESVVNLLVEDHVYRGVHGSVRSICKQCGIKADKVVDLVLQGMKPTLALEEVDHGDLAQVLGRLPKED